ncbi:hypothetical protein BDEG_26026 [Batrachochytrium dendrobatidis JEL423]|nr:hypothetical protein BDEG_26026 [Batrachochytrium dendrobatidis JEL423]
MHIKTALALSIALAANAVFAGDESQKDGKKAPGGGVAKLSKSAAATGATTATATATAAAVAAAAAAAGPSSGPSSGPDLNPSLTPLCLAGLQVKLMELSIACPGLTPEILHKPDLSKLLKDDVFLDSFCSDMCRSAVSSFGPSLKPVCGDQKLFKPKARLSTDDAPSVEGLTGDLTVSSISSYVGLGQKQGCIRTEDKSKFCLRTQYEEQVSEGLKATAEDPNLANVHQVLVASDLFQKEAIQAKEKAGTTADKPKDKSGTVVVGNTFTAALAASAIIAIMFHHFNIQLYLNAESLNMDGFVGGALKLKGTTSGSKISKKNKKSKKTSHTTPGSNDTSTTHTTTESKEKSVDSGMTEAERKFREVQRKRLDAKAEKIASKSHKERVADLNAYLESLSEHHDIPRVGPG